LHDLAQEFEVDLPPKPTGFSPLSLREDLLPNRCGLALEAVDKLSYEALRQQAGIVLQASDLPLPTGRNAEVPCLHVQLSRTAAQKMVRQIQSRDGLQAICLLSIMDPFSGEPNLVAIAQLGNGEFQDLGAFWFRSPEGREQRLKQWRRQIKGKPVRTALLVSQGLKGEDAGEISAENLIAVFEVPCTVPPMSPLRFPPGLS
jgi:hypothetical protein